MSAEAKVGTALLDHNVTTGATTLSTRQGSMLSRFLDGLAGVWSEPQRVQIDHTMPVRLFADREFIQQIEEELITRLWLALSTQQLMPLSKPTVQWGWTPEMNQQQPKDRDTAHFAYFRPGDQPPRTGFMRCIADVLAIPLPDADLFYRR